MHNNKAEIQNVGKLASIAFSVDTKQETKAQFIDRINKMYNIHLSITLKSEEIKRLDSEMVNNRKLLQHKAERHNREVSRFGLLCSSRDFVLDEILTDIDKQTNLNDDLKNQIAQSEVSLEDMKKIMSEVDEQISELVPFTDLHLRYSDSPEEGSGGIEEIRNLFACSTSFEFFDDNVTIPDIATEEVMTM